MTSFNSRIALSAIALLAGSTAALAVPIVATSSSSGAFPVSAVDLLNGNVGVVTGTALGGQEGTSANPAVLTNGLFGTGGGPLDLAQTVSIGNNTTITYSLNTVAFSQGFSITGINVYSGWRDAGRDNQNYSVLYSTVAAPAVFIPITSVAFAPAPANSGASMITDTTGTLATGVAALRFTFGNQENGYVGYREIDVAGFGIVTIPEPATLATLCLGGLALLRRRRAA